MNNGNKDSLDTFSTVFIFTLLYLVILPIVNLQYIAFVLIY
jgi:hypothetical protein